MNKFQRTLMVLVTIIALSGLLMHSHNARLQQPSGISGMVVYEDDKAAEADDLAETEQKLKELGFDRVNEDARVEG